jgi:hypothetical protein
MGRGTRGKRNRLRILNGARERYLLAVAIKRYLLAVAIKRYLLAVAIIEKVRASALGVDHSRGPRHLLRRCRRLLRSECQTVPVPISVKLGSHASITRPDTFAPW